MNPIAKTLTWSLDSNLKFAFINQQWSMLLKSRSSPKHSDPSSLNFLIKNYVKSFPTKSVQVFFFMRRRGIRPNSHTFPFVVKACATLLALKGGLQVHADVVKHGLDYNVYVGNTLIHFYGACQKIHYARQVFDEMSVRTVVSWNTVMSVYVDHSLFDELITVFVSMRDSGFDPDETTMVVLLTGCTKIGNLSFGRWVHSQVIGKGLVLNCELGTALVDMYAKCGYVDCADLVFNRMAKRNVWTWSAMILGLAQHGFAEKSLNLFQEMKKSTILPNYVTFLGVLSACSHAGLVNDGYWFFHEMERVYDIRPMMIHYGAMVDILGRSGRLKEAYRFIEDMPMKPDPIVWRTLLSACSIHDVNGDDEVGSEVRKRLLEMEPRRSGNFVMVANKYAEVGLWEKAEKVRRFMRDGGLKKMAGESCVNVGGFVYRFFSGYDPRVDYEDIYELLRRLNLHMKMVNHILP